MLSTTEELKVPKEEHRIFYLNDGEIYMQYDIPTKELWVDRQIYGLFRSKFNIFYDVLNIKIIKKLMKSEFNIEVNDVLQSYMGLDTWWEIFSKEINNG